MKKTIGMLVMLMGLTANAQNYPTQQEVEKNYPPIYRECVGNTLNTSINNESYTLSMFKDENNNPYLISTLIVDSLTYIYKMDVNFKSIYVDVRRKEGQYTKTVRYTL